MTELRRDPYEHPQVDPLLRGAVRAIARACRDRGQIDPELLDDARELLQDAWELDPGNAKTRTVARTWRTANDRRLSTVAPDDWVDQELVNLRKRDLERGRFAHGATPRHH